MAQSSSELEATSGGSMKSIFVVDFRAVKGYENYVRDVRRALLKAYERKSGHRPMAEHQTKEAFKSYGLPWVE